MENIKSTLTKIKPTRAQKQIAFAFIPSAACFGLAGFLTLVYYSDWRVVTDYIPLYNTKYPKPEKPAK